MYLRRALQEPRVIAVGQHGSAPPRDPVDGAGEARADGLHAASERIAVARLDDQVRVIPLKRVVHEPEARPHAAACEGSLDLVDDRHGAEWRDALPHPHRDVHRQWSREPLTRAVPDPRRSGRLPPGSGSASTPARRVLEGEIELGRSPRHDLECGDVRGLWRARWQRLTRRGGDSWAAVGFLGHAGPNVQSLGVRATTAESRARNVTHDRVRNGKAVG